MTQSDWTPIAIIVGAFLFIYFMGQHPMTTYTPPAASGSQTYNFVLPSYPTPSPAPAPEPARPDLRILFQPYLVAYPDAPTTCRVLGGTWHWETNYVGCTDTIGAITICGDPAMAVAINNCLAVGANTLCDATTAYCRYA